MVDLNFVIRPYRSGDEAAMAQIYFDATRQIASRVYSTEQVIAWAPTVPDPTGFAARAADGRITLLAVEALDGPIIAFGDLESDGHVDYLYCRPDAARAGIASALLVALLAQGCAANIGRYYVEASELARGVFARQGFRLVERRDFAIDGTPIHNFLMVRDTAARPPGAR